MPQTKFVLAKALKLGLKPIVVINKIDRPDQRHQEVVNEVFDLFAALDATDEQLDFPIIYGSAKQGWMSTTPQKQDDNMAALFDMIVSHFKPPVVEDGPFRMLVTTIEANPFLGRVLTGRIRPARSRPTMAVKALGSDGKVAEHGRISKVLSFRGLERIPVEEGLCRRHHCHFRPDDCHRGRHDCRSVGDRADPGAAHRSADPHHDLPHQ